MTIDTILRLNQLNAEFYNTIALDFAASREQPWPGWSELLPHLTELKDVKELRILDIGCGTGRFGQFLAKHFSPDQIFYTGLDNSFKLLAVAKENLEPILPHVNLTQLDLIENLLSQEKPALELKSFDLIVVFGVLHHIPSLRLRQHFFAELKRLLSDHGQVWLTTWQFAVQSRFQDKFILPEKLGFSATDIEANDFFLPWERGTQAVRYCHYTDDQELQELAQMADLKIEQTFASDGRGLDLNHYFVLKPQQKLQK